MSSVRNWLPTREVPALRRLLTLAAFLGPARVVPIHSEAGDRSPQLFAHVDRQPAGVWWDIAGVGIVDRADVRANETA